MIMSKLEYWILSQVILETLLVVLVVYFLFKIRQISKIRLEPQELKNIVQETLQLKAELRENLQAKKEIINNLVKQLDLRLETARELLQALETQTASVQLSPRRCEDSKPPGSGGSLLDKVERLKLQGFSVDEIARQLQISKGEVLLGLDLARAKSK